jgi:large subunit ribosomal protein L13
MTEHTIDAQNMKLGRLATQAAVLLMGKQEAEYKKNVVAPVRVIIKNASQLDLSPKRLESLTYDRYSGYPGGLKTETAEKVIAKKGYSEIIRRAVNGMLPKNKLRDERMKRLVVEE